MQPLGKGRDGHAGGTPTAVGAMSFAARTSLTQGACRIEQAVPLDMRAPAQEELNDAGTTMALHV